MRPHLYMLTYSILIHHVTKLITFVDRKGYTGHSFNDFNHVDLTTMRDGSSNNTNDGQVRSQGYTGTSFGLFLEKKYLICFSLSIFL
jgi:hypothetical protein